MQTASNKAAAVLSHDGFVHAKPLDMQKRIGSTVYQTLVYTGFTQSNLNNSAAETIEEKIMRLVRNDLNTPSGHVNITVPQTGPVASPNKLGGERSSA